MKSALAFAVHDFFNHFRRVKITVVPNTSAPAAPASEPQADVVGNQDELTLPMEQPLEGEIVDKGVEVRVVCDDQEAYLSKERPEHDLDPIIAVVPATIRAVVDPVQPAEKEPEADFWSMAIRRQERRAPVVVESDKALIALGNVPRGYSLLKIGEETGLVHGTNKGINALIRVGVDEFRVISNNKRFGGRVTVNAEVAKMFLGGRY